MKEIDGASNIHIAHRIHLTFTSPLYPLSTSPLISPFISLPFLTLSCFPSVTLPIPVRPYVRFLSFSLSSFALSPFTSCSPFPSILFFLSSQPSYHTFPLQTLLSLPSSHPSYPCPLVCSSSSSLILPLIIYLYCLRSGSPPAFPKSLAPSFLSSAHHQSLSLTVHPLYSPSFYLSLHIFFPISSFVFIRDPSPLLYWLLYSHLFSALPPSCLSSSPFSHTHLTHGCSPSSTYLLLYTISLAPSFLIHSTPPILCFPPLSLSRFYMHEDCFACIIAFSFTSPAMVSLFIYSNLIAL